VDSHELAENLAAGRVVVHSHSRIVDSTPPCGGRPDQRSFLETETDNIKKSIIPNGLYPANDPNKPIIPFGATAAWEFDISMSPQAYIRWVSSRLEPTFTPGPNSHPPILFFRYRDGDEETIRIDSSPHSGGAHVRVALADIIHDFGDTEILLWYKHVEMTMF
jgi:hypothetical protein